MSVITVGSAAFRGDSQVLFTFPGFIDGNGNPLTSSGGSVKISITDALAGTVLLAATAMTYSGTPGTWTYTAAAAACPDWTILNVSMVGYDQTGATTYVTQDVVLTPFPPLQGTYSRGAINSYTFPQFSLPGGALLDNTNSSAKVGIVAYRSGTVILAPTAMTWNAGTLSWVLNDTAAHYGAGQKLLVTYQGFNLGGGTIYTTRREILKDGG